MQILQEQYQAARELLEKHRKQLDALAERLFTREKLEAEDLAEILGPRAA